MAEKTMNSDKPDPQFNYLPVGEMVLVSRVPTSEERQIIELFADAVQASPVVDESVMSRLGRGILGR